MERPAPLTINRRDAVRLMSMGAAAGALSVLNEDVFAAIPAQSSAAGIRPGAVVRTVLGDQPPDRMGTGSILFHEHLSIDIPPLAPRPADAPPPVTDNLQMVTDLVNRAGGEGVSCIVDGGHPDMGTDFEALRRIAGATNVHIVASGGYYMHRTYPPDIAVKTDDQIADDLIQEASVRRYGALGEIGVMPDAPDLSPDERKVFRAVGKAHIRTGLPVFTHNSYGTGPNVPRDIGLRQLDVLESMGVPPDRIVIGHACCLDDPAAEVFIRIAKRGAYVGFDRVTSPSRTPIELKVRMARAFLDAGFGSQLLLSSDFTGQRTLEAGPGYARAQTVFAPLLVRAGISENTVRQLLHDNPLRWLAFSPKPGA